MIAFASVDLPDPFGPIRALIEPDSTSRLTPLRISLPSAVTCRLRISSSANSTPVVWVEVVRYAGLTAAALGAGAGEGLAENAARSASVVPASALVTPPCTRVQRSLVEQAWSPSVSCEQETLPSGSAWKHSI